MPSGQVVVEKRRNNGKKKDLVYLVAATNHHMYSSPGATKNIRAVKEPRLYSVYQSNY
jgi:spore germination protein YaaH